MHFAVLLYLAIAATILFGSSAAFFLPRKEASIPYPILLAIGFLLLVVVSLLWPVTLPLAYWRRST